MERTSTELMLLFLRMKNLWALPRLWENFQESRKTSHPEIADNGRVIVHVFKKCGELSVMPTITKWQRFMNTTARTINQSKQPQALQFRLHKCLISHKNYYCPNSWVILQRHLDRLLTRKVNNSTSIRLIHYTLRMLVQCHLSSVIPLYPFRVWLERVWTTKVWDLIFYQRKLNSFLFGTVKPGNINCLFVCYLSSSIMPLVFSRHAPPHFSILHNNNTNNTFDTLKRNIQGILWTILTECVWVHSSRAAFCFILSAFGNGSASLKSPLLHEYPDAEAHNPQIWSYYATIQNLPQRMRRLYWFRQFRTQQPQKNTEMPFHQNIGNWVCNNTPGRSWWLSRVGASHRRESQARTISASDTDS